MGGLRRRQFRTSYDSLEAAMNIRVERKDGAIITIDVVGEWRMEPVELHRLAGQDMPHVFTREGYYDHSEPRPAPPPSTEAHRLDIGPSEGTACVP
jgi:hypothetical protein